MSRRHGFTLLEISIGLVLMGLMVAVAVPSLNAVTGARLKESTNLLAGGIRDTYARTALLGRSTRRQPHIVHHYRNIALFGHRHIRPVIHHQIFRTAPPNAQPLARQSTISSRCTSAARAG